MVSENSTLNESKRPKLEENIDEKPCENESSEVPDKNPGETPPNPLSKNQQKKQVKLARFEEVKRLRRIREREKQKQKRQLALEQGMPTRVGPSRKELKKRQTAVTDNPNALTVAIDLDFDDIMHDRDVAKCIKQCLRIYTINRRSQCPGKLHFTGLKSEGRLHGALKKNDGWENWNVQYHFDENHLNAFEKEQIVYLTCESDNVLERLEAGRVYIIGGLIDHNHQKGLCHERATQAGIQTARLPLSEHVEMKTRSVLSTFHVFEILVRLAEGKSWTNAIMETIPMRKGAVAKTSAAKEEISNDQQTDKTETPSSTDEKEKSVNDATGEVSNDIVINS